MPIEDQLRALARDATEGGRKALLKSDGLTGVIAVHGMSSCKIYTTPLDPVNLPETHERQKADAKLIAALPPETITALCDVVAAARVFKRYFGAVKADQFPESAYHHYVNMKNALAAIDALEGTDGN